MIRRVLLLLSVATAACGSEDSGPSTTSPTTDSAVLSDSAEDTEVVADAPLPTDAVVVADSGTDSADPYGAYPAGPYGINEGDTLQGLAWEGYVNEKADALSTTKPWVSTSLDKLRRTGKGYGLIHVSEYT